jgi:hypothetical protein
MKRRGFLGLLVGSALGSMIAKALPAKTNPEWKIVVPRDWGYQGTRGISYLVNNYSGTYQGMYRGDVRVTFPAPVSGQDHWAIGTATARQDVGALGPHFLLKG